MRSGRRGKRKEGVGGGERRDGVSIRGREWVRGGRSKGGVWEEQERRGVGEGAGEEGGGRRSGRGRPGDEASI